MNLRSRIEREATPKGFYALNLKRFHKADGTVVVPNEEGYFVPQDQEELDILTHHMAQGRVDIHTHHMAQGRVDFEPAPAVEQE